VDRPAQPGTRWMRKRGSTLVTIVLRQMPKHGRHSGKLPTHHRGEKGRSDMARARELIPCRDEPSRNDF
ncbi:MAG: hypothetical protein ACI4XG_19905, partial [Bradyrhizobium sp.]